MLLVLKTDLDPAIEHPRDHVQAALELTKKDIQAVREADNLADLERFYQKPYDTTVRVQLSGTAKPDLKLLNETFKVLLRSVQEVWASRQPENRGSAPRSPLQQPRRRHKGMNPNRNLNPRPTGN